MENQSNSTPPSANSSPIDPLDEASPDSLDEYMNRAPQISDSEAAVILVYLRAQKEKFAQQEAAPKVKKAPKAKGPKPILSVDELLSGLD